MLLLFHSFVLSVDCCAWFTHMLQMGQVHSAQMDVIDGHECQFDEKTLEALVNDSWAKSQMIAFYNAAKQTKQLTRFYSESLQVDILGTKYNGFKVFLAFAETSQDGKIRLFLATLKSNKMDMTALAELVTKLIKNSGALDVLLKGLKTL